MMMTMQATETPKGVWLSTLMMSAPLFTMTTYLAVMAPMAANAQLVDPTHFAFVARSCLRMMSLNLAFLGGVHYGLGAAVYDTARSEEEKKSIEMQMVYSFVPAAVGSISTGFMLFQSPLTLPHVVYGFTSLLITQLVTSRFDVSCVKKELAPLWFKGYRQRVWAMYMFATTVLFGVYYTHYDKIQRRNDPNRIENIKTVLALEDLDFVKMVDELKIQFDESELAEVEKQLSSQMRGRVAPGARQAGGQSRYD